MSLPSILRKPLERLVSLARDRRATVAVITAVAIVPLVATMGLAVDLTRAYMYRQKLNAALDQAALAVGQTYSDGSATLNQAAQNNVAQAFVNAAFANSCSNCVSTSSVSQNGNKLSVSATVTMQNSFLRLIPNNNTMAISTTSVVTLAQTEGLEVVLVLDNTGSLNYVDPTTGQTNIEALKTAAGKLVLDLFGSASASNGVLKMGIVPYVAAVNPGTAAPFMLQNPPTQITFNATTGAESDPADWLGCVVERASTFPLSALGKTLTYTQVATDLDTPVSTTANNYLTQYIWPKTGHPSNLNWTSTTINPGPFTNGNTAAGPNQSCPTPTIPLTNNETTLLNSIGANTTTGVGIVNQGMEAWNNGGTIGSIGMSWGYRMLSPNGPYALNNLETVSTWKNPDWQKIIVLMTDGVNNINVNGGITDYNGAPASQNPTVSQVDQEEELVCDALRANGVIIYSVFVNSNSSPGPAISYCAGTAPGSGSTSYYFQTSNQAQLYQAFSSIATSISQLHVSQ